MKNIEKQCFVCGNFFLTSQDTPHWFCLSSKLCRFMKWITKK